jgi:hypothetical protein
MKYSLQVLSDKKTKLIQCRNQSLKELKTHTKSKDKSKIRECNESIFFLDERIKDLQYTLGMLRQIQKYQESNLIK